jgi:hypothetical protein
MYKEYQGVTMQSLAVALLAVHGLSIFRLNRIGNSLPETLIQIAVVVVMIAAGVLYSRHHFKTNARARRHIQNKIKEDLKEKAQRETQ